jgi:hypothetical protein
MFKNFLEKAYEFIVDVKTRQAEQYLAKSTDHADLERRQKELAHKGII